MTDSGAYAVIEFVDGVAFALFPFLPMRFGVPDAGVWRISSGAYFAANAAGVLLFARHVRQLAREGVREPPPMDLILFLVEVGVSILLILVVLGVFPQFASSFYLVGLCVGLLECGIAFFRVVSSFLVDSRP